MKTGIGVGNIIGSTNDAFFQGDVERGDNGRLAT